jgi:hypothetical protein
MHFTIAWEEPKKVKVENGSTQWRREWRIPYTLRPGFFAFWNKSKFSLKDEGFSVYKDGDEWVFTETKLNTILFKKFPGQPAPVEIEEVTLPVYKVKDVSGLREWQVASVSRLCSALEYWGSAIDGSDTGCHAKGQLILMSDGTSKKVEDIIVGEKVMGWKGPQTVTELKRGNQQMAKIIPTKGDPWVVNLDHILTVQLTSGCSPTHKTTSGYKYREIADIKVRDWLSLPSCTKHAMKLFSVGVNCWRKKDLPFSPYFIGALLGDGGLSQNGCVSFTSHDKEVWNEIRKEGKKFDWTFGKTSEKTTKRITNSPSLFRWLRTTGLLPVKCECRFIPNEYKTSNTEQRLELLAGLLDTDGYYRNVGYDYVSKSKQLAEDVSFLARSLGFFTLIKKVKKTCYNNGKSGIYYSVSISGNCHLIPTKIPRKISSIRKQKKRHNVTGFTVELLKEDDYYGFSLDGDGRFLLGDFTVTHNTGKTYVACAVARELGMKIVVICPKSVRESWRRVIINHFKMKDQLVGITNYEQLRIGKKDSLIASFVTNKKTHRDKFTWKITKDTLIIWDESQKLKNWKTQNSKTCIEAFKQGFKMLFCSATNATNPLELRTVGTVLKMFKGARQYYDWAYQHGVYRGQWGMVFTEDIKRRTEVLKKLHKDIFVNRGVRLTRDTIPNFPDSEIIADCYNMDDEEIKQINLIYGEMSIELKKLEKLIKRDKAAEMVAILRARQKIELIKVPLFIDMVEEALEDGMSAVIFVNFTDTIKALSKRLNTECIFDGKTADKVRQANVDDFQADKQRVILINIASGGAGLSLHDLIGDHPRLALISPSYSAVLMRQATGRVWRDDAKTKSIQKIVFVAGTVEEDVCENVRQKLENLDLLNDGDLASERLTFSGLGGKVE